MMIRTLLAITITIVTTLPAAAQPTGSQAQAEVLFRQGKDLMAAGKVAEACAAFDASQKLEATISTRFNQANCREKNNQLATAWGVFLDAERQTRSARDAATKQLHKVAVERAAKLEARVSTIRIVVPPERKVSGLEIRRNGELVDPATWNTPLPVDGGSYKFTARAPGLPEWSTTITLAVERDAKTVDVPRLDLARPQPQPEPPQPQPQPQPQQPQPPQPQPQPVQQPPAPTPMPSPVEPSDQPSRLTTKRKIALGLAGLGLAATGFGIARGTAASSKQSDAEALCPDPSTPCEEAGRATELTRSGHRLAIQANVGFAVGAGAVIAAGVLWFTGAPAANGVAVAPRVTPDDVGVTVMGRF